jgi:hypothetical protein
MKLIAKCGKFQMHELHIVTPQYEQSENHFTVATASRCANGLCAGRRRAESSKPPAAESEAQRPAAESKLSRHRCQSWIERAEIVWPGGRKESFANLKANQVVVLEEGKGRVSANTTTKAKAK